MEEIRNGKGRGRGGARPGAGRKKKDTVTFWGRVKIPTYNTIMSLTKELGMRPGEVVDMFVELGTAAMEREGDRPSE